MRHHEPRELAAERAFKEQRPIIYPFFPFFLFVSYSRWREAEEMSIGYSGREELSRTVTSSHS